MQNSCISKCTEKQYKVHQKRFCLLNPNLYNICKPFEMRRGGFGLGRKDCYCSVASSYLTLCDPKDCSMPGSPVLHYLPELAQIRVHWVMLSNHLILRCPRLPLPLLFASCRAFCNDSALRIREPKYWSFSISLSNEYSGLISLGIDQFDLLTAKGL